MLEGGKDQTNYILMDSLQLKKYIYHSLFNNPVGLRSNKNWGKGKGNQ